MRRVDTAITTIRTKGTTRSEDRGEGRDRREKCVTLDSHLSMYIYSIYKRGLIAITHRRHKCNYYYYYYYHINNRAKAITTISFLRASCERIVQVSILLRSRDDSTIRIRSLSADSFAAHRASNCARLTEECHRRK